MKISSILGLNARAGLFSYKYSNSAGKKLARSKILTKRTLKHNDVAIPEVYRVFRRARDIHAFDFNSLPSAFALKPSKGMGGQGIIVVKKKSLDGQGWVSTQRKKITPEDLAIHTLDIIEGAYSVGNVPDVAFCEEYVGRHKAFRKYSYRGTPDIRVIVFNKVPVMAMLRLPTEDSGGRANLHQGAIGVGVDVATGITTHAVWYGESIKYKPGTKKKLHGIKIPQWSRVLELAVRTQIAAGLGYVGVDIVLHPLRGPMVLEINSQPGLGIQLANMAGLRQRLAKVEDLRVIDGDHGVQIAKALFGSHFAGRVRSDDHVRTLKILEEIQIKGPNGQRVTARAKIDTGAWRTAIDARLARDLGFLSDPSMVLQKRKVRSALGHAERPVILFTFWLKGRKIVTQAGVTNRNSLKRPVIIGRRDLSGFVIEPQTYNRTQEK
jgi:alpha-L-glutamate ligase-like protein